MPFAPLMRCLAVPFITAGIAAQILSCGTQESARPASETSYGSTQPQGAAGRDEAALRARADKLHRESIVIDTHNDITSPMIDQGFDLGTSGDDPNAKVRTHTDIRRMRAGGLGAE